MQKIENLKNVHCIREVLKLPKTLVGIYVTIFLKECSDFLIMNF
jgi:hypothetical protein